MAMLLGEGAMVSCSMGTAPMPMIVPPEGPLLATGMPTATILDFVPLENIPSFGLCTSLANPEVDAATIAAEGALTPMPCVPATMSPWLPGAPGVLAEGIPVLCSGSICLCDWMGEISIDEPGQMRVSVEG